MLDLAIDNGTVITMDSERRVLIGGSVGILANRLVAVVEHPGKIPEAHRRIDAAGMFVLPGIIDTHGHGGHSLTRGLGEGGIDNGWTNVVEEMYFRASDSSFWEAESRLAALERLRFGVTTSVSMTGSSPRIDHPRYAVAAATGYAELGLRHIVAVGPPNGPWPWHYRDLSNPDRPQDVEISLEQALWVTGEAVEAVRAVSPGRIDCYVGPSSISPSANPADDEARCQVTGVKRIVERMNAGLHAHAFQGQICAAYAIDPEIFGPHACLAHCAGIDLEEIEILARTGTSASSGPLTHAYALNRFGVIEALDAGVNVVFSTDGSAPDRNFDLIDQVWIGAQLQRVHFNDDTLLPAGKVLGMITIDAAKALNMVEEIGSLEPGKLADVTIVNGRAAHLAPNFAAPLRVVELASGHDVDTVIVGGRVLMENRTVPDVDAAGILHGAESAFAETYARTSFSDPDVRHPDSWHGNRYGDAG